MRRLRVPEGFSLERARRFQEFVASRVVQRDEFGPLRKVGGVDVTYKGDLAISAAVVIDPGTLRVVDWSTSVTEVRFPYIPTLLAFREIWPAVRALRGLRSTPDIVLVDGNGRLHPYRAGFASHLGVVMDVPTVGVAKKLLCGRVGEWRGNSAPVYLDDEVIGIALLTRKGSRPIYVSVGHRVSLSTAVRLVLRLTKPGKRLPEPIVQAHRLTRSAALEI